MAGALAVISEWGIELDKATVNTGLPPLLLLVTVASVSQLW